MEVDKLFKLFVYNNSKLGELMKIIRDIDRDHNGYVTSTELDDIIKMMFSAKNMTRLARVDGVDSLDNYDLKPIFRPFASSANRVLIDYKGFRDFLIEGTRKIKEAKVDAPAQSRQSTPKASKAATPISLKRSTHLMEEARQSARAEEEAQSKLSLQPRAVTVKEKLNANTL